MRKLILTVIAASFILGLVGAAGATEFLKGTVVVEFEDTVDPRLLPGSKNSGYSTLDKLAERFDVYEVEPVFELPETPINHPRGGWTWGDLCDSIEKCRLAYVFVIRYRAANDPEEVAGAYKKDPNVINASPEMAKGKACLTFPNDTAFSNQWYFYYPSNRECDISAAEGWDYHPLPFSPVTVGVIDSGIWASQPSYNFVHQDIKANVVPGGDAIGETGFPMDIDGHGTAVTGIIGAHTNNNQGIAGLGWNEVKVMPVRAFYHDPGDPLYCARAMVWAVNNFAEVLNLSWYYECDPAEKPMEIVKAVEHAIEMNVSLVAAEGETGGAQFEYPADDYNNEMIAVAGTERVSSGWARWPESSYNNLPTVDIAAPAYPDIYTTSLDNGFANVYGNSYATAMTSAAVAGYRAVLGWEDLLNATIADDARYCVWYSGVRWGHIPGKTLETGYGTFYYDQGLAKAFELAPWNQDNIGPNNGSARPGSAAAVTNFPNPASASTTFRIVLSTKGTTRAELVIYDLSGRKVRTFGVPVRDGAAEVAWDLRSSAGARVAPGVYIYKVNANGVTSAKKCVVH